MDDAGVPARAPWRRAAAVLGWVALAALLVPVAVRLSGWERGPLAYVVPLVPWVVPAALVPAVLAVLGRAWVLLGTSIAAAALCAAWTVPLYTAVPASGEVALTVATVNLRAGEGDAEAVVRLVREHDVDVLSVQELTPEAADALVAAGLEEALPHAAALPDAVWSGTGLWSAHPIAAWEGLDGYTFRQVRATVELPGGAVTVLALHPAAPQLLVHRAWSEEMGALVDLLDAVDGPVIAAGDLNTARDHAAFRDLEARGFRDAADEAGAGLVPTFPQDRTPPPLVAIDHVVTRDLGLVATSLDTVVVPGSDHRALIAAYAAP
ncbi:endonuclease/exonuclease/phosphatase family protein [Demequina sp. SYSU T00192]|uniref:Endonuclease/exonuclease/phosphatase family protein n=1 Tax=Demequina litoralis TaxID=3051660 RepID=A0ABT8GCY4_9MICO|nr:endonuclease/exonuclease/phosphatase family protein [Demequina sp. SYSU T00192]MDN4477003.1 endonuclease/exonuclease/phosphatase family protein [Demequina sp. SYSU T00192]